MKGKDAERAVWHCRFCPWAYSEQLYDCHQYDGALSKFIPAGNK